MPINRVPVVHKFGIISQSQRIELEERIAKKALSETRRKIISQQTPEPRPLPFEVTEDFVYKFNDSCHEEKVKLEDTAMKMLKRLKRLAGLREAGEVDHADLPRAWADLALLAQCRSHKLEKACLEALVASLDQAVVSEDHILSLFYLAKSGIHWLKKNSEGQAVLRSIEINFITMTRLAFLRLYCHHLLGRLHAYKDQQTSLAQYLKGFSEKKESYEQFPGAYVSLRFIVESGSVICSSSKMTAYVDRNEVNEPRGAKVQKQDEATATEDFPREDDQYFTESNFDDQNRSNVAFLWHCLHVWQTAKYEKSKIDKALYALFQNFSVRALESWLDVVFGFYILTDASHDNAHVLNAFQSLMSLDFSTVPVPLDPVSLCETCYSSFSNTREKNPCNSVTFKQDSSKKNCLDHHKANSQLNVLENLQKFVEFELTDEQSSIDVSKNIQNLPCCGSQATQTTPSCTRSGDVYITHAANDIGVMEINDSKTIKNANIPRSVNFGMAKDVEIASKGEVIHRNRIEENQKNATLIGGISCLSEETSAIRNAETTAQDNEDSSDECKREGQSNHEDCIHGISCGSANQPLHCNTEFSCVTKEKHKAKEVKNDLPGDPEQCGMISANCQGGKERKKSQAHDYSKVSYSVGTQAQKRGNHWPWEVVYTFCECMTTLCLRGTSSYTQKIALLGQENRCNMNAHDGTVTTRYGLRNLLKYDQHETGWKVRYGVVKGLARICHHYYNNVTKEGLKNAAWSSLMYCQSVEKDPRVLDAIKIAKVEAELQNKLANENIPMCLWTSRLSSALSQEFYWQTHPRQIHAFSSPSATSNECHSRRKSTETSEIAAKAKSQSLTKPSLRQEISLSNACQAPHMDYNTRMNLQLRAVIEHQWKKQLVEGIEKEITHNIEELDKKRDKQLDTKYNHTELGSKKC